jgi:hypothetical protein
MPKREIEEASQILHPSWQNVKMGYCLRENCEKDPSAAEAALINAPGGTAKAAP